MALTACDQGIPIAPYLEGTGPMRYLPTQAEASSGVRYSNGARMMLARRQQRMDERNQRSGVEA